MAATRRLNAELVKKYSAIENISTDPIEKIRAQCLSRGASGIKGLGRLFKIMDDNENKTLDFKEFKKGLHDYGIDLSGDELFNVFKTFDRDDSGSIDFEEFLETLRPPMSKARRNLVSEAYRKIDKNKDGHITVEDLKGVYCVKKHPKYLSGEWNEEKCLREFLDSFDMRGNKNGIVTEEEFLNYYSGVSASVDNDAYFDLMMRNAWKL